MKRISVGRESFAKFIENENYYVDKTSLIKEIFKNDQSDVLLITRPRRFGKTLAMSTFHEFLRINPSNPDNPEDTSYQERLFKDTEIFEDKEFCREFMGKFPVIFVSFKDIIGGDFTSAYEQMGSTICGLASKFGYLLENKNGRLTESQLTRLKKISDLDFLFDIKNKTYLADSLTTLTELLNAYHGIRPMLLIDEYDVPIAKAASRGYYDEMIDIMRPLLCKVLKTNSCLGKAVLTGCLRAAKESIFTGLNNLKVCSVLDDGNQALSEGIGFTKEETEQVLKYYNLDKYSDLVTDNYDGYYFGEVHMYCPWDVMNFCLDNYQKAQKADARIIAANYWINSSGNDVIEEYMGYIQPENVDLMQTLIDGGSITSAVRPSLCYGDLKNHEIEDFWTLLLYTGYLTFNPKSVRYDDSTNGDCVCDLRIPNKEVRLCFKNRILSFFRENPLMKSSTVDLAKGLFSGEAQKVEENIANLLEKYISVRDFAANAPKESYYHGFMNGSLVNAASQIMEQASNLESGNGYVDLLIKSRRDKSIAIIELKQTDDEFDDIGMIADKGLEQIKAKKYAEKWVKRGDVNSVYIYGICFYRKQCSVAAEKLK